jgi:hypothetical protein
MESKVFCKRRRFQAVRILLTYISGVGSPKYGRPVTATSSRQESKERKIHGIWWEHQVINKMSSLSVRAGKPYLPPMLSVRGTRRREAWAGHMSVTQNVITLFPAPEPYFLVPDGVLFLSPGLAWAAPCSLGWDVASLFDTFRSPDGVSPGLPWSRLPN